MLVVEGLSGGLWRLTIQPVVPHLEVHARPPDITSVSPFRLIVTRVDLARGLAAR